MARIATEEPQPGRRTVGRPPDDLRWQPHRIPQNETQDVTIEVKRFSIVGGCQNHMPKTLLCGDELVPVRAHHPTVFECGAVEHLQSVSGRVDEPNHLVDATVGQLSCSGFLEGNALLIESVPDLL